MKKEIKMVIIEIVLLIAIVFLGQIIAANYFSIDMNQSVSEEIQTDSNEE